MTKTFTLRSYKNFVLFKLVAQCLCVSLTWAFCAFHGPWTGSDWNYTDPKDPNRNYTIENGIAHFADNNWIESAKMIYNGPFVDIYAFENVQRIQTIFS